MEILGERLKRLRAAKGWTQEKLTTEAGVGQSTINGIEKGARQKMPSSLIEIAHALGVDAYWLKTGIGDMYGKGRKLNNDEDLLLQALPLIGEELRDSWLYLAKKAVDRNSGDQAKAA